MAMKCRDGNRTKYMMLFCFISLCLSFLEIFHAYLGIRVLDDIEDDRRISVLHACIR
jgi:hypothetical protein